MNLEDRVKTLELELKVLKNEIQVTMLEIQEQVLLRYHPALRAGGEDAGRRGREGANRGSEALFQGQNGTAGDGEVVVQEVIQTAPAANAQVNRANFTDLVEWVSRSAEEIGVDRTNRVLEIYTDGGYLTAGQKEILMQLMALSDEDSEPERVSIKEMLNVLLELNKLLGYEGDVSETLSLIQEQSVG